MNRSCTHGPAWLQMIYIYTEKGFPCELGKLTAPRWQPVVLVWLVEWHPENRSPQEVTKYE